MQNTNVVCCSHILMTFGGFLFFSCWLPAKMSSGVVLSPSHAVNKTRNAILRMKKCSPELRTVLRQRCQERIQNERSKILHTFRRIKIQDSFRAAFGSILKEEWKNISDESSQPPPGNFLDLTNEEFNLDEKLLLEELLEKELILEHEDWLLQLYEELLSEDVEESREVVCPLCCSGYLRQTKCYSFNRTSCTKCPASFVVGKSLLDLQATIFECLRQHDKQCSYNSSFSNVPKNEVDNNLCVICHHCSFLCIIE